MGSIISNQSNELFKSLWPVAGELTGIGNSANKKSVEEKRNKWGNINQFAYYGVIGSFGVGVLSTVAIVSFPILGTLGTIFSVISTVGYYDVARFSANASDYIKELIQQASQQSSQQDLPVDLTADVCKKILKDLCDGTLVAKYWVPLCCNWMIDRTFMASDQQQSQS